MSPDLFALLHKCPGERRSDDAIDSHCILISVARNQVAKHLIRRVEWSNSICFSHEKRREGDATFAMQMSVNDCLLAL